MSTNDPLDPLDPHRSSSSAGAGDDTRNFGEPHRSSAGDTHNFGDLQVSTGKQSAYITVELILYLLAVLGVFITAAIIDEDGPGPGFSASRAWYYVTLLTVGFLISRGLAKINSRGDSNRVL
jgi:hypothetical protein